MYIQTGDVLYFSIPNIPRGKKIGGNLIHKGENHSHTIRGKFALSEKDGEMFIDAKADCTLEHEEHKTVTLPKGKYQKRIVVEFDHWTEEARSVVD